MGHKPYSERTPEDYLQRMEPQIFASLKSDQLQEFKRLLEEAIPKPNPKIVDLRVVIDLIVARYYMVLWVGNDRRKAPRRYAKKPLTYISNIVVVCLILLSLNVTLTVGLFMTAYLLKSAVGIDLLPGHLGDNFKSIGEDQ
ncbi:MAG: hypothetical protein F6K42_11230 [Leptolyngbya sp. SIO1D8]|nr:hypothetical protein [Leptolyngbya sp. SIO1D8]